MHRCGGHSTTTRPRPAGCVGSRASAAPVAGRARRGQRQRRGRLPRPDGAQRLDRRVCDPGPITKGACGSQPGWLLGRREPHLVFRCLCSERVSFVLLSYRLCEGGSRVVVGAHDSPREDLRIFLSYRRSDTPGYAGRIYDYLVKRFDEYRVFMDIDAIRPGSDFTEAIGHAIDECDVLLALIGPTWLTVVNEDDHRRLNTPDDFVRKELEAALRRGIPILPVLVQNAAMPARHELPDSLAQLATRQAFEVSDRRWRTDVTALIDELERLGNEQPSRHATTQLDFAPLGDSAGAVAETGPQHIPAQNVHQAREQPASPNNPGDLGETRRRPPVDVAIRKRLQVIALSIFLVAVLVGAVVTWIRTADEGASPAPDSVSTSGDSPAFVVDSIPVRGRVQSLAIDPENHTLYTGNLDGDTQIFDTSTRSLIGTIPIDGGVSHLVLDPRSHTLYSENFNERTVNIVNTVDRMVVDRISVPDNPNGLAFNAIAGILYVATANNGGVLVIDPADPATIPATIPTELRPVALATDESGELTLNALFVATSDDVNAGSILVVDATPGVIGKIPLDHKPLDVLFNRAPDLEGDTGTIYVSTEDGSVSFIDLAAKAVVANVPVGRSPYGLAIDPGRHSLYVANYDDNSVTVIDTKLQKVVATISVGKHPSTVLVDPLTHIVYCANVGDTSISVITPAES